MTGAVRYVTKLDSLIAKFEEAPTRERRRDPWNRPRMAAMLQEAETGRIQPVAGIQTEYALTLKLTSSYWANTAQHSEARKRAEQCLQDYLYRDVVGALKQIRGMLDSASREDVELALTELIAELQP